MIFVILMKGSEKWTLVEFREHTNMNTFAYRVCLAATKSAYRISRYYEVTYETGIETAHTKRISAHFRRV